MKYTIQHRRGTTAQWSTANPVLAFGEVGVENTGAGLRSKIGDGATVWESLPYADDSALAAALAAETNAVSHADTGDATTLASANTHADTAATSALDSAKSYTNTKTSGLAEALFNSGMRNIDSFLSTSFTASWVRLIRKGPVVSVHITNLSYSGGGTGTVSVMNLPDGFQPPITAYAYTTRAKSAWVTSSGVLQIGSPGLSVDSTSFTYLTQSAIPTVLPGTPA